MRPIKLLIDENLSPAVATNLRAEGFDVVHARDRGLLAASDEQVFAKALAEDRVVVTSNVADFVALAQSADLHGGAVLVEDGALLRDEQEQVIRHALTALAGEYSAGRDMLNRVLRVDLAGNTAFEDVPKGKT